MVKAKKDERRPLNVVLRATGACAEAIEWAEPIGTDYERAWKTCERGEWLLWILYKLAGNDPASAERRALTLVAVKIARSTHARLSSNKHLKAFGFVIDPRATRALEVAEKWGNGDPSVTLADLRAARVEAWNARADAYIRRVAAWGRAAAARRAAEAMAAVAAAAVAMAVAAAAVAMAVAAAAEAVAAARKKASPAKLENLREKARELRAHADDLWRPYWSGNYWKDARKLLADRIREHVPNPPEVPSDLKERAA